MKTRILAGALALGLAAPLAVPTAAQADHRHSRSCRHSYYDDYGYDGDRYRSYPRYENYRYDPYYPRYDYPRYGHRYDYRYDYRYGYRSYDPYRYSDYRYAPPPAYVHYHGRVRCSRPHLSIRLGW